MPTQMRESKTEMAGTHADTKWGSYCQTGITMDNTEVEGDQRTLGEENPRKKRWQLKEDLEVVAQVIGGLRQVGLLLIVLRERNARSRVNQKSQWNSVSQHLMLVHTSMSIRGILVHSSMFTCNISLCLLDVHKVAKQKKTREISGLYYES